jgi:hypothetical protein
MVTSFEFKRFELPTGESAWIPVDVDLRLPAESSIEPRLLRHLAFLPWDDRYLARVDAAYRGLFLRALPFLHVRTTDVHVATCLPFARTLLDAEPEGADEQVVHVAFILHDSGWSQMSETEIAESLGVQGLALSGAAVGPKARHAELGRDLARRILDEFPLAPPLTARQRELIDQAILFHDKPGELAAMGELPPSVRMVCDVDHLWSFTHENFWQDTVRKGVDPAVYFENLAGDLDGYFVGEAGKRQARQALASRQVEVEAWKRWIEDRSA